MPVCKECNETVDEVTSVKVGNKRRKVCEACAELIAEQAEIAEMGEEAMRDMMGYKGNW